MDMTQFLEELNSAITEILADELDPRVAWLMAEGCAPVEVEQAFVSSVADAVERRLACRGFLLPAGRPLAN